MCYPGCVYSIICIIWVDLQVMSYLIKKSFASCASESDGFPVSAGDATTDFTSVCVCGFKTPWTCECSCRERVLPLSLQFSLWS